MSTDIQSKTIAQIVPVVCAVLQQSTYQLPPPTRPSQQAMEEDGKECPSLDVKLKVCNGK